MSDGEKVVVTFKNIDESVEAEKGESLMEVTKKEGWPIAYGCEDGMCGTCLVKGDDGLSKIEEKEQMTLEVMGLEDTGYRLACQCKVDGDTELEQ